MNFDGWSSISFIFHSTMYHVCMILWQLYVCNNVIFMRMCCRVIICVFAQHNSSSLILPSDPTHYWLGDIFTRWPIWKKNVKSFHDTYCRHAIWQENYDLFSKTFIYNLDIRACTELQSSFPLTYFSYMFSQNLKI